MKEICNLQYVTNARFRKKHKTCYTFVPERKTLFGKVIPAYWTSVSGFKYFKDHFEGPEYSIEGNDIFVSAAIDLEFVNKETYTYYFDSDEEAQEALRKILTDIEKPLIIE